MKGRIWTLPGLKQLRRSGRLNAMLHRCYGDFWGTFPTRYAALGYLRPSDRVVYDDDRMVDINVDLFGRIHPFDWPIIFYLQRLIAEGKLRRVIDLGGHIGVKYFAYRTVIDFPADMAWQVVEVPAMCREGRKRATGLPRLAFYDRIGDAEPSDVLICSGAIQYFDTPFENILSDLSTPPPMILLNKISYTDEPSFYTLESFGIGRMPHRVMALSELNAAREHCGYSLATRWDIPHRTFVVRAADGEHAVHMIGEAWNSRRSAASSDSETDTSSERRAMASADGSMPREAAPRAAP